MSGIAGAGIAVLLALIPGRGSGYAAVSGPSAARWPRIEPVPGTWQQPAEGCAWYRRFVRIPAGWKGGDIRLQAGVIDDADDTFVNGIKVGSTDGWALTRVYEVDPGLVRFGAWNLIAIRVRNRGGAGGISGDARVFTADESISLNGGWEFRDGDDMAWAAWPMEPGTIAADTFAEDLARLLEKRGVLFSILRAGEKTGSLETVGVARSREVVMEERRVSMPLKGAGIVQYPPDGGGSKPGGMKIENMPAGPGVFEILPPRGTGPEVSVAEFGASAESRDNYRAFQAAIDHCRRTKASRLLVPAGVYRFASRNRLSFDGLSDFVFDGQGSELVFSEMGFIQVRGCERAVFRNVVLDWDWDREPLAYVGKVAGADRDRRLLEIVFPPVPAVGEEIKWPCVEMVDPETFAPTLGGYEIWGPKIDKVENPRPDTLRVFTRDDRMFGLEPGNTIRLRQYVYECHAVLVEDSRHISFDRLTIHSAPGMGFVVCGDSHHFELTGCRIVPRPGGHRPISVTADGLHLGNTQGYFRVEGCEFALLGDDAMNVKDSTSIGVVRADSRTLIAKNVFQWRNPFSKGDVLEFRNPDYSPAGVSPRIVSASYFHESAQCRLKFDGDLPAALDPDTVLFNRRYNTAHFVIRNNYFHENRARGILLKCSDGLIEGNRFFRTGGPALSIEVGPPEGTIVENVIVRNNEIRNCDAYHWADGVISFGVYGLAAQRPLWPPFRDILFQGNTVSDYPRHPICLRYCKNVTVIDNVFRLESMPPLGSRGWGAVRVEDSEDVAVFGNKWEGAFRKDNLGVYVNTDTVAGFRDRP